MLTDLKVSSLACKWASYRSEHWRIELAFEDLKIKNEIFQPIDSQSYGHQNVNDGTFFVFYAAFFQLIFVRYFPKTPFWRHLKRQFTWLSRSMTEKLFLMMRQNITRLLYKVRIWYPRLLAQLPLIKRTSTKQWKGSDPSTHACFTCSHTSLLYLWNTRHKIQSSTLLSSHCFLSKHSNTLRV